MEVVPEAFLNTNNFWDQIREVSKVKSLFLPFTEFWKMEVVQEAFLNTKNF